MKVLIISPKNKTVFNFRGDLVKAMIAEGHEVSVVGPDKEFEQDIYDLGVKKLIVLPLEKDKIGVLNDYKYLKMLRDVYKNEKPDVVFSYTIKPVIYGSLAGKKFENIKFFPMITGLGRLYTNVSFKKKIIQAMVGRLYKQAFKYTDKVIFQNYDDMELFVGKKYLPKSKAVKIDGSGVNMERFHPSENSQKNTFIMISRIMKEKGVLEYAEAAQKVKEKYADAKFYLLGFVDDSFDKTLLQPYIDDESIEVLAEVKDVVDYLSKMAVFVLPTYYREGIPRTILEAMASGKPVITTDWVGCREAVTDGVNGFLVPIKNSEQLAKRMIELINTPELVETMGEKGREICSERFDVDLINEKMLTFMELKK